MIPGRKQTKLRSHSLSHIIRQLTLANTVAEFNQTGTSPFFYHIRVLLESTLPQNCAVFSRLVRFQLREFVLFVGHEEVQVLLLIL